MIFFEYGIHRFVRLLIFIFAIIQLGCGDSLNITGIHITGEDGPDLIGVEGNPDKNDWCLNSDQGWAFFPGYPNPASESITIQYQLHRESEVKLQIINENKKVVRILVDEVQFSSGNHSVRWDLTDDSGNRLKNGYYRAQFFIDAEFKCKGDIKVVAKGV